MRTLFLKGLNNKIDMFVGYCLLDDDNLQFLNIVINCSTAASALSDYFLICCAITTHFSSICEKKKY